MVNHIYNLGGIPYTHPPEWFDTSCPVCRRECGEPPGGEQVQELLKEGRRLSSLCTQQADTIKELQRSGRRWEE